MSKQTAVEFLAKSLKDFPHIKHSQSFKDLVNQAKAMEKQQSISDYCEGFKASGEGWNGEYGLKDMLDVAGEIDAEDYYNKTYGGDMSKQEEPKQYTNEELEGFEDFKKLIKPKQETLEEAAAKYVEQITTIEFGKPHNAPHRVKTFIEGAKSEAARDYWFEQFKKNGGDK